MLCFHWCQYENRVKLASDKQGGESTCSVPLESLDVSPTGHYYGTRSDVYALSLTTPPVSLFYLLWALCPSHWCVCKGWGNKAVCLFMAAGTVYGWCVLTASRSDLSASRRAAHSLRFPHAIFHLEVHSSNEVCIHMCLALAGWISTHLKRHSDDHSCLTASNV